MEPFRYLYYQTYRFLASTKINPDPKDNAIYFLLIFQILNGVTAYVFVREIFNIETLRNSAIEKIFPLALAGLLWYLDVTLINFDDVHNKYRKTGFVGFLVLFFYLTLSCLLLFYTRQI